MSALSALHIPDSQPCQPLHLCELCNHWRVCLPVLDGMPASTHKAVFCSSYLSHLTGLGCNNRNCHVRVFVGSKHRVHGHANQMLYIAMDQVGWKLQKRPNCLGCTNSHQSELQRLFPDEELFGYLLCSGSVNCLPCHHITEPDRVDILRFGSPAHVHDKPMTERTHVVSSWYTLASHMH